MERCRNYGRATSAVTGLFDVATHNKSLDASGGSVFRIIIGPAKVE